MWKNLDLIAFKNKVEVVILIFQVSLMSFSRVHQAQTGLLRKFLSKILGKPSKPSRICTRIIVIFLLERVRGSSLWGNMPTFAWRRPNLESNLTIPRTVAVTEGLGAPQSTKSWGSRRDWLSNSYTLFKKGSRRQVWCTSWTRWTRLIPSTNQTLRVLRCLRTTNRWWRGYLNLLWIVDLLFLDNNNSYFNILFMSNLE